MRYFLAVVVFSFSMFVWRLGGVDFDERGYEQAFSVTISFLITIWVVGGYIAFIEED